MSSDDVTEVSNETEALQQILEWSQSRPNWQRDALRRLVLNENLQESDIEELTIICKDSEQPFLPLTIDHITATQSGSPSVALKKIKKAENINALVPNQTLSLLPKGVTVIYGDNGAGKSGYARLLKRACRARVSNGREEAILPNIYEDGSSQQSASFDYSMGTQNKNTSWTDETPASGDLSEISVFDSRTANVHVEDTNDLAYTPYPMKLLERLAKACDSIKGKLELEVGTIQAQTPQVISNPKCLDSTVTGRLIVSLTKDTSLDDIDNLAELSDDDNARMVQLTSDLSDNPAVKARQLRAQKFRLLDFQSRLRKLENAISEESRNILAELKQEHHDKKEAARVASENLFQDGPVEGVGSQAWRSLWEAAREFSTSEAYKEQSFPHVSEQAKCVLCHQDLDRDSSARLLRFEQFVQDRTQKDVSISEANLKEHRDKLRNAKISQSALLKEWLFIEDELGDVDLAENLRKYTGFSLWYLRSVLRDKSIDFPAFKLSETGLNEAIEALETRASCILANEESEERIKLRNELNELKDRQWLATVKDDITAEIHRMSSIHIFKEAIRDTRPNTITTKNTSLSKALVTDRLRTRFTQEIDKLNLAGLAIELSQQNSQRGVSRFKISLMQKPSQNAGDILSEGEYRCVALAGFLAELATNQSNSGIIFDDPVSSLDHLHREAIARRIAEEGKSRQVIVFTHDLPFLFLLRNACTQGGDPSDKTEIALRHIQKKNDSPGYCRNEAPDKAQDSKTKLDSLRTHLNNTRVIYENDPDGTDWIINARGLIDSLRQTWETAVEDSISPVLRTFSSKINTKGFGKLSAITLEDAEDMRSCYGRLSELLHKISDEMNPTAPEPSVIEEELNILASWVENISDRQSNI